MPKSNLMITNVPAAPGVYMIWGRGRLLYIGTSGNMRKRCATHRGVPLWKDAYADRIEFFVCEDRKTRQSLERWLISVYAVSMEINVMAAKSSKPLSPRVLAKFGYERVEEYRQVAR